MNKNYPVHIVAAGAFVSNSQGQVLMIKSPRYGDWEFPGGQVEESDTRKPSIVNMDFICEFISGDPKPSAESSQVEWVDRKDALSRVKRKAIHQRLKAMMEFSGEITYGAYFVDPNRVDFNYQEVQWRKI